MKQVMGTYCDDEKYGEVKFFFNGDKLITGINGNDGNYRHEYMNCLFNSFGIEVKSLTKLNKKQSQSLKEYAKKYLDMGDEE